MGDGAPTPSLSFRLSGSAGGAWVLLGDVVTSRDVNVPFDIRIYGFPYPGCPNIPATRAIAERQVDLEGDVEAVATADNPPSVGCGSHIVFPGSLFPGPALSEHQRMG